MKTWEIIILTPNANGLYVYDEAAREANERQQKMFEVLVAVAKVGGVLRIDMHYRPKLPEWF
jgi:hypothetical protein